MPIVQKPTREELQAIVDDLQARRSKLMDEHGLFGGGEIVNIKIEGLTKLYDKAKEQLDNYQDK